MDIDHHIRILKAHAGAFVFAIPVLEPVDNSILHTVGDKARMPELFGVGHSVNGERLVGRQQC